MQVLDMRVTPSQGEHKNPYKQDCLLCVLCAKPSAWGFLGLVSLKVMGHCVGCLHPLTSSLLNEV